MDFQEFMDLVREEAMARVLRNRRGRGATR
jgi:hypothetical protein